MKNRAQDRNRIITIDLTMTPEIEITLLGTGGGRFATITQKRRTAGIQMISEDLHLHLDPGPGALVYSVSEGLNPQKLNAVFVSHCHPDHYTDAEVLIEAMSRGTTKKRGVLVASKSVLHGNEMGFDPVISKYHQQMPEHVIEAVPNTNFKVGNINVLVTEARHTDPDTVGFRFETSVGSFAYTSDTEYFEGVNKYYGGLRLLILCVMRPAGKPWTGHMTTNDAIKIMEQARPEQAVLTHFGMQMIFKGPAKQARLIEEETGVPTIAAKDGIQIKLGETIGVQVSRKAQQGLNRFF